MYHSLARPPHGGVYGHHAEVAVLVHEGDGGGGDEAEGEGHGEPHQQDHHAVEPAQLVSPQGGEGYDGGRAVDDSTREYAPHKHRHPAVNIGSFLEELLKEFCFRTTSD